MQLPRPLPRGFEREEGFKPTVTIYNPTSDPAAWQIHNIDEVIAILEHYQLRYTVVDYLGKNARLKDYGEMFYDTDVLISPHDHFQVNFMWLGVHVSVIEVLPSSLFNNQFEVQSKVLSKYNSLPLSLRVLN